MISYQLIRQELS